jgi:hypothetical protein
MNFRINLLNNSAHLGTNEFQTLLPEFHGNITYLKLGFFIAEIQVTQYLILRLLLLKIHDFYAFHCLL